MPDERLFRRFAKGELVADGKLAATSIGYDGWSVNRNKYSEPEDVLIPDWSLWGVAMFLVKDLPSNIRSAQGSNIFDFKPEHKPEERNYSHTEIVTFKNGIVARSPSPSTEIKKKYRQLLRDRIEILKPAAI